MNRERVLNKNTLYSGELHQFTAYSKFCLNFLNAKTETVDPRRRPRDNGGPSRISDTLSLIPPEEVLLQERAKTS